MQKSDASGTFHSSHKVTLYTEQLALYEQYGALAYGVILQLLPDESVAQEVLVEVFTSPVLLASTEQDRTLRVVQTARTHAIAYKQRNALDQEIEIKGQTLPERVFNLAFHHGLSPDEIALKLGIPRASVLKAINEHFKHFRKS